MIIRNSNIHIRNIIVYENCKAIWLNCHICILATCLALTSCLSTVKGEKHKHFWYGSAPFEKRQTLEAYKRDTLPAIERFQTQLSQAGAGVFKRDEDVGDQSCGKNNVGREYWNSGGRGRNIDAAIAIKYGDQILVPAGFTKKVVKKYDNGDVALSWYNVGDGGFVSVIITANTATAFGTTGIHYVSGCRPTDGSTTPPPSPTPTERWTAPEPLTPGTAPSSAQTPTDTQSPS